MCFIGVFLCVFGFSCYICAALLFAATQVFLSGKAEMAVETRQVFHRRPIWIADAHRDGRKWFVLRANEKLTAFLELESGD
jgi:hypothetical protein